MPRQLEDGLELGRDDQAHPMRKEWWCEDCDGIGYDDGGPGSWTCHVCGGSGLAPGWKRTRLISRNINPSALRLAISALQSECEELDEEAAITLEDDARELRKPRVYAPFIPAPGPPLSYTDSTRLAAQELAQRFESALLSPMLRSESVSGLPTEDGTRPDGEQHDVPESALQQEPHERHDAGSTLEHPDDHDLDGGTQ